MLIGLTGCKGSGKDTVGQHLVDNYDFTRLAFADKMYEAIGNLFDITAEQMSEFKKDGAQIILEIPYHNQNMSSGIPLKLLPWCEFLQSFGTAMGRKTFGQDFWVQQWEEELYRNSLAKDRVVATDVCFANEAYRILHLGGIIAEIRRPGHEPDGHVFEEPLQNDLIDVYFDNNGTIDQLHNQIDNWITPLLESR